MSYIFLQHMILPPLANFVTSHTFNTDSTVFFKTHDSWKTVSFPNKESDGNGGLDELIKCSVPATFGMGEKEVYDESYRKALVFKDQFYSTFPIHELFKSYITSHLFGDTDWNKFDLVLEPDKLNVYQKDGFFNKHQDTPRSNTFIGTCVVIFPTTFTGGKLFVEKNGITETFKSHTCHTTCVAFYGDCNHWISPVTSGTRVTLSYNILLLPKPTIESPISTGTVAKIKDELERIKEFDGYYAISCQYEYTVSTVENLVENSLKGIDRTIFNILQKNQYNPIISSCLKFVDEYDSDDDEFPFCGANDCSIDEGDDYGCDGILEEDSIYYDSKGNQKCSICSNNFGLVNICKECFIKTCKSCKTSCVPKCHYTDGHFWCIQSPRNFHVIADVVYAKNFNNSYFPTNGTLDILRRKFNAKIVKHNQIRWLTDYPTRFTEETTISGIYGNDPASSLDIYQSFCFLFKK